MGLFNIISKAVQYVAPLAVEKIHEKNETLGVSDDTEQLLQECRDILSKIQETPIENNRELIQLFDVFDTRILKLERIICECREEEEEYAEEEYEGDDTSADESADEEEDTVDGEDEEIDEIDRVDNEVHNMNNLRNKKFNEILSQYQETAHLLFEEQKKFDLFSPEYKELGEKIDSYNKMYIKMLDHTMSSGELIESLDMITSIVEDKVSKIMDIFRN